VSPFKLRLAARLLRAGGVVAYPTEGVYGLGCDPLDGAAVDTVLRLKGRSRRKGLILIAADFEQVAPFLAPLRDPKLAKRLALDWPGPVTWVLRAGWAVPSWLTGGRDTLAVRVTAHAGAAALCRAFGRTLVSTSANRSGGAPARSALAVRRLFGDAVDMILHGPLGGLAGPTPIRDGTSGKLLRS
jgi:L-threonylcarbamoyladenylate synthase